MTNQNITISGKQFSIVEYLNERVLTFSMIDNMHERAEGTAKRNFIDNKKRFVKGKHYYVVEFSEKNEFRAFGVNIPPRGLTVLTQRGYLLLAKSLTDDKAWDVQERLIDRYFKQYDSSKPPTFPPNQKLALADHSERYYLAKYEGTTLISQVLITPDLLKSFTAEQYPNLSLVDNAKMAGELNRILHDLDRLKLPFLGSYQSVVSDFLKQTALV